jgi:hypothetical protein
MSVAARGEIERFAAAALTLVGPDVAEVRFWPFRDGDLVCWSLEVVGCGQPLSLTLTERGRTHLPELARGDFCGQVADGVDAYCLLEFLTRELQPRSPSV